MSSSNSQTDYGTVPSQRNRAFGSSLEAKAQRVGEKIDEWKKGEWGNPVMILVAAIASSLVLGVLLYVATTELFAQGAIFGETGWVASQSGLLFIAVVIVAIAGVAGAFGLSWESNSRSLFATVVSVFVLMALVWAMLKLAEANHSFGFWASTIVLILLGIILPVYGMYMLYKRHKESAMSDDPQEKKDHIEKHYKWSLGLGIVGLLALIGVAAAAFRISGVLGIKSIIYKIYI